MILGAGKVEQVKVPDGLNSIPDAPWWESQLAGIILWPLHTNKEISKGIDEYFLVGKRKKEMALT